jgi:hypothetical protein
MNKFFMGLLAAGAIAAVGCKQAKVESDDVNGVNAKKATNAVFGVAAQEGLDINGDGADDFEISQVIVLASDLDGEELCALLGDPLNNDDDPNNDVIPDDFITAFAVAGRIDAAGAGVALASGDVVVGDPNAQAFPFFFVDGGFSVRQGGVDIAVTSGEGDGTFELTAVEADIFEGLLTSTMTTDLSGDVEVDIGQVAFTAEFRNVQSCEFLNGI